MGEGLQVPPHMRMREPLRQGRASLYLRPWESMHFDGHAGQPGAPPRCHHGRAGTRGTSKQLLQSVEPLAAAVPAGAGPDASTRTADLRYPHACMHPSQPQHGRKDDMHAFVKGLQQSAAMGWPTG